ncbi:MAG TPA: hypothetical protein VEC99_17710 [Clostridia bacterium]|nr:hypothetical protein [Clostridia bacterium]
MKTNLWFFCAFAYFGLNSFSIAQTGPFDPESWPATIDSTKAVHYVVTDGSFTPPSDSWHEGSLSFLTGGDQVTADFTIGGHTGKKVTGNFMNIADSEYPEWADDEFIDVLVQVYGDPALFNAQGDPRDFTFLIGTLPDPSFPVGGQVPVEAKNKRWNWILFRIPNGTRPDGTRFVGSVPDNAQGDTRAGGVNGGTIRFETVPGIIVRVVAFGAQGAFGQPEDINKFLPPETCAPEPETNLVGLDFATGTTNHLIVLSGHDHTVTFVDDVGPTGDKRRAVVPDGAYLNFGILSNYLGLPCNDPRTVKVCMDFYDDPAFAGMGVRIGPEAYATDDKGGIASYPAEKRHLLTGSGLWIRRSWTVPAVNLKGVNSDEYTAGPRFYVENGQVAVSRVELAVLRVGTNALAGQDPLAACYEDPNICNGTYGSYAELDLAKDIRDGLDLGTSSGDQNMVVEEAGPPNDRRLAVRPAQDEGTSGFSHQFLNFAITDEKLGPSSQPPAHLAICLTYYDDPNLVGTGIRPEVYATERNGEPTLGFVPATALVTLTGSGQWKKAYWEIPDIQFRGVNQGPQAAARFTTVDADTVQAKIAVTQVRYGIIRPCGPLANVNPLLDCKPPPEISLGIEHAGTALKLSWPTNAGVFQVESTLSLSAPSWGVTNVTAEVVNDRNVVTIPIGTGAQYFRLAR